MWEAMRDSALDAQYASIELWKGRVGLEFRSLSVLGLVEYPRMVLGISYQYKLVQHLDSTTTRKELTSLLKRWWRCAWPTDVGLLLREWSSWRRQRVGRCPFRSHRSRLKLIRTICFNRGAQLPGLQEETRDGECRWPLPRWNRKPQIELSRAQQRIGGFQNVVKLGNEFAVLGSGPSFERQRGLDVRLPERGS